MYVGINSGEIRSPKEFPSKSSQSQLFCQSQLELVVASVRGMSVHGRVPVCDLNVLAGHGTHSFNLFSRNPAAHGPHSVAPSDVATEFTGHSTHGPPFGPAEPALQVQSVNGITLTNNNTHNPALCGILISSTTGYIHKSQ